MAGGGIGDLDEGKKEIPQCVATPKTRRMRETLHSDEINQRLVEIMVSSNRSESSHQGDENRGENEETRFAEVEGKESQLVGVEATSTEEEFEAILGEELMMKKRRAEEVRSYANAWCGDDEAKILSEGPQISFVNRNEGREEQGSWGTAEKEKMGSESQKVEECCRTPVKPRRLKPIRESREMCMIPKWRSKGGQGSIHYGNSSPSTSDIINCNNRLKTEEVDSESVRIWEVGKQLGLECSGDEGTMTTHMESMEVRDTENMKKYEEGINKVV